MATDGLAVGFSRPNSPLGEVQRGAITDSVTVERHHQIEDVITALLNSLRVLSNPSASKNERTTIYEAINRISPSVISEAVQNSNNTNMLCLAGGPSYEEVRAPRPGYGATDDISPEVLKQFQSLYAGGHISTQGSESDNAPLKMREMLSSLTTVAEKFNLSSLAVIRLIKRTLGSSLRQFFEHLTINGYDDLQSLYNDLICHLESGTTSPSDAAHQLRVLMNSNIHSIPNFIESLLNLCFKSHQDAVNNNQRNVSSYLLATQLLKNYIADKAPALWARISSQLSLQNASLQNLPIEVSSRRSFSMLASLVRKNKEYLEKKPQTRNVREIKEEHLDEAVNTDQPGIQHSTHVKPTIPWRSAKMRK